jgi:hypothetical protein
MLADGNVLKHSLLHIAAHTFNLDTRVRIKFCCCGNRSISPLIIILAINLVTVLVNKRRVPTYNISLKACVFDSLVL